MNVSPFGKPEQGPNFYLFDPSVRYSMHITQDGATPTTFASTSDS